MQTKRYIREHIQEYVLDVLIKEKCLTLAISLLYKDIKIDKSRTNKLDIINSRLSNFGIVAWFPWGKKADYWRRIHKLCLNNQKIKLYESN